MVEDNLSLSQVVVAALDLVGIDVTVVRNSSQALELAHSRRFDGALVDVDLGDGPRGTEVALALHEIVPDMPVIITTGMDADSISAPEGTQVLRKPYRAGDVVRQLQHFGGP